MELTDDDARYLAQFAWMAYNNRVLLAIKKNGFEISDLVDKKDIKKSFDDLPEDVQDAYICSVRAVVRRIKFINAD